MLTDTQTRAIHRLIAAAASLNALADSGAIGEGYDGAEPQCAAVVGALDELADANLVAMQQFADTYAMAEPAPVAWMNPSERVVWRAFAWKKTSTYPEFSVPVFAQPLTE